MAARRCLLLLAFAAAAVTAAVAAQGGRGAAPAAEEQAGAAAGGGGPGVRIEFIRVGSMVLIAAIKITFAFGALHFRTQPALLSIANAFAAGVFLAGGFAHLLPEAVESFSALGRVEGPHGDEGEPGHHHGHEHHGHEHGCGPGWGPYVISAAGFLMTFYLEKVFLRGGGDAHSHSHAQPDVEGGGGTAHDHSHGMLAALSLQQKQGGEAALAPLVLTLVLSVHSVVAGMALGVQTEASKALLVLLAIVAHKWVEAFSLGVSIVRAQLPLPAMGRLVGAFACSSPLGVALGWGLRQATEGAAARTVTAVLDAAASGTFIYIAVVDTLQEEFSSGGRDGQRKFLAVIAGFAMMLWLGEATHAH